MPIAKERNKTKQTKPKIEGTVFFFVNIINNKNVYNNSTSNVYFHVQGIVNKITIMMKK